MLIRKLLFLLFFFLMTGCVRHHEINNLDPVSKIAHETVETRVLPSFDKIYIDAPVNVNLHTNMRAAQVTLRGNSADLPLIYTSVKNQVLYVTLGRKEGHLSKKKIQYGPIDLTIDMPAIHGLTYRGKGRVVASINTDYMDAWIKNPGKTLLNGQINLHQLTVVGPGYTQINGVKGDNLSVALYRNPKVEITGMAALTTLDVRGNARFSYYWMRGRSLIIRAHEGAPKIQLAGIVEKLDVELWGGARLNGRYIRARETFVKTHQHAIAEISTTARQHTLAMDASDIYFYNLSPYLTNFMGENGAVLDLRDWDLLLEQEYTPYNK